MGLLFFSWTPWDPQADSAVAHTSRTVVTASFMRGEYIDRRDPGIPLAPSSPARGGAPGQSAVLRIRGRWRPRAAASPATTQAEMVITPSSRRSTSTTSELLLGLRQGADLGGPLQAPLVEHRLGRERAQLLGHERHRQRQQGVQVEQVFAGVMAGGGERRRGAIASTTTLPWPTRRATQKARAGAAANVPRPPHPAARARPPPG